MSCRVSVVPRILNQTQESSGGNVFESVLSFYCSPRQITLLQRTMTYSRIFFPPEMLPTYRSYTVRLLNLLIDYLQDI
jgi:hypothetical protein